MGTKIACCYTRTAQSPGIKLALVGHQEDLHLLLEADGSLGCSGGGAARQWHGGAAVPVLVLAEAVEAAPGGEGRLVALGSLVALKVDCDLLVGAAGRGRGGGGSAAPISSDFRPSPLLLPRQHASWSTAAGWEGERCREKEAAGQERWPERHGGGHVRGGRELAYPHWRDHGRRSLRHHQADATGGCLPRGHSTPARRRSKLLLLLSSVSADWSAASPLGDEGLRCSAFERSFGGLSWRAVCQTFFRPPFRERDWRFFDRSARLSAV